MAARRYWNAGPHVRSRKLSVGTTLLAIFFAVGALTCLATIFALLFPGSFLESIWRLKPEARVEFLQIGRGLSIALMLIVAGACASSAIGLARNAEWGRRLALAVLIINLIGDSLNALFRHDPRTLIGIPIGALMICYLLRRRRARI
jgi:hypothetical protein